MNTETTANERIEIELSAPPDRVYEAIATADGVRSWWTAGDVAEEVGGVSRLSFGHGWIELRVEKLVPGREVEWACVAQHIEHFDPTDEWVGTRIRFRMEPLDDGRRTRLEFLHEGLAGLGCEESLHHGLGPLHPREPPRTGGEGRRGCRPRGRQPVRSGQRSSGSP
jgi:uncharacterized protein YndB with AHSA1/START domain